MKTKKKKNNPKSRVDVKRYLVLREAVNSLERKGQRRR